MMRRWLAPCIFLLLPPAYAPGTMSVSVAGRWAVVSVGAALLMFTVEMTASTTVLWGATITAWMALGLLWTSSTPDVLGGIAHWVPLLALAVWASEQRDLRICWIAYAIGVSVSLPFAVLQYFGVHTVTDIGSTGFYPVGGLFLTSNVLAEVSTLALVASVGLRCWPLVALTAACALLSGRREVWLMLGAAALAWLWSAGRKREAVALSVVALVAVGAAYFYLPGWGVSDSMRLSMWRETTTGLTLLGTGVNTFTNYHPSFPYAHSDPLQMLFELGVGSAVVFWGIARALSGGSVLERAMLAALCAAACVWFPLEDPTTAFVGVVLAGYLLGERDRAERARPLLGARDLPRDNRASRHTTRAVRPNRSRYALVSDGPQSAMGARDISSALQQPGGRGRRSSQGV